MFCPYHNLSQSQSYGGRQSFPDILTDFIRFFPWCLTKSSMFEVCLKVYPQMGLRATQLFPKNHSKASKTMTSGLSCIVWKQTNPRVCKSVIFKKLLHLHAFTLLLFCHLTKQITCWILSDLKQGRVSLIDCEQKKKKKRFCVFIQCM